MKKNNDKNVETITREGELTPLEKFERQRVKQAHFMKLMRETQAIVEGIEKLPEIEGVLGLSKEMLDEMTDKALVALANEMEEHFGVSA